MTDSLRALFLKSLALEGQIPTVSAGPILIAAGAVYGAAGLGHWALVAGLIPIPTPWVFPVLWLGATGLFLAVLALFRRAVGRAGPAGPGALATALAWQGVGLTIFVLFVCLSIIGWHSRSFAPLQVMPSIDLALYGLAWMVAAVVYRQRWVALATVGYYAMAILLAVLSDSASEMLVFALSMVPLAIVPGVVILRRDRRKA
jgi:hypothetical protein